MRLSPLKVYGDCTHCTAPSSASLSSLKRSPQTLWIDGHNSHRRSLESVTNHLPSAFVWRTNRRAPRGFHVCLPRSPKYPWSITHPLLIDYPNSRLYVDLLGWQLIYLLRHRFEHILIMPMLTLTTPRVFTQRHIALLPKCFPYVSGTCPTDASFSCRISYTRRTHHCSHCSHCSSLSS